MNEGLDAKVRGFLTDRELDEFWRQKVVNSVQSIDVVFRTQVSPDDVRFCQLTPQQLWVNCEEEIDLPYADTLEPTLSVRRLAPITVVEYQGRYAIYMGSVRAVLFCRYQKIVDCIVVRLHTDRAAAFFHAAQKRLSDFDIYH